MNNAERKFIRDTWDRERPEDDPRVQLVTRTYPGGITQVQIGQLMGLSRQRIQQIELRAMAKLRRRIPWLTGMRPEDPPVRTARSRHGVRVQRDALPIEMQERLGAE